MTHIGTKAKMLTGGVKHETRLCANLMELHAPETCDEAEYSPPLNCLQTKHSSVWRFAEALSTEKIMYRG
jgi:hypothetical protein